MKIEKFTGLCVRKLKKNGPSERKFVFSYYGSHIWCKGSIFYADFKIVNVSSWQIFPKKLTIKTRPHYFFTLEFYCSRFLIYVCYHNEDTRLIQLCNLHTNVFHQDKYSTDIGSTVLYMYGLISNYCRILFLPDCLNCPGCFRFFWRFI